MYEDSNTVQRIHTDLLAQGGFDITARLVQEVQVKVAEVYLVMEASEDVQIFVLGFMKAWWFLWWALVKFASLRPRSVWTNHGELKYACHSRLGWAYQWVCPFLQLWECCAANHKSCL